MSATIIDGKAIASATQDEIKARVDQLVEQGVRPGLAVILVGDNPASQVYVRNKVKACEAVGMHSSLDRYPADLTETKLLQRIQELNQDPDIHGILVHLPLARRYSPQHP